jgi:hypothetical protein
MGNSLISATRPALAHFWTRDSRILLGGFFVTILLIAYVWWPLAVEYFAYVDWTGEWWRYVDWLLIGIFGFVSIAMTTGADITLRNARRPGSSQPGRSRVRESPGGYTIINAMNMEELPKGAQSCPIITSIRVNDAMSM